MIKLLFLLFLLSSFSCFGALFKKKFEEIMPITVVGIMIFLYLFYILNLLNIGFIFLVIVMLIIYLIFFIKLFKSDKRKRKEIFSCIFTPGFVIYILGFFILYLITYSNKVLLWDELRLWAAYPKILFYEGSLQLGEGASLLSEMRSYNPGLPIFIYYILKVMGSFKENLLFFAYSLVGFSILIPITKNIKWKEWIKIPFYLIGLLLLPLLFANSNNDNLVYYFTLFIEPVLGIIFGYSMYLTFSNVLNDKYKYLLLVIMVSGIVLFKDTGILFSIIIGLSFVLSEIFNYKNYKKEKYGVIKLLFVLVFPILIFCSWKGVQSLYKSENMYTSVLDKKEIVSLFFHPTAEQETLLSKAKSEILFTPIVKSNFSSLDRFYTFPILFFCLLFFLFLYMFICGKKEFKNNIFPIICFIIGSIIFFLGTIFVYFFSIHTVASFPRYISLLFTSGSVLLIFLLSDKYFAINNRVKNKKFLNYFIYLLIVFSIFVLPIRQPKVSSLNTLKDYDLLCEEYANIISNNANSNQNVLLVFNEKHQPNFNYVIFHHHIYLDLLDEGFKSLDNIFVSDSFDYNDYINYDYVYFLILDKDDELLFELNMNCDLDGSTIFKVVNNEEKVSLLKVS